MSSLESSGGYTEAIRVPMQRQSIQFDALELTVADGPDAGYQGSFSLPILRIGSASDNDLVLNDRAISRHHAELRMTAEGVLLRDLNSTNGTFLNQYRLPPELPYPIKNGDEIQFGNLLVLPIRSPSTRPTTCLWCPAGYPMAAR